MLVENGRFSYSIHEKDFQEMNKDQSKYTIALYHPDYYSEVVDLLRYLWGENHAQNLAYFRWKYHDNPFSDDVAGIVAIYQNKVVGFRGYFATKWCIKNGNQEVCVLSPGDACVHPDHRLKRLSVLMGDMAMSEYESKYKLFFNFSASKISVPGNLRMGFVPIINKTYLNRDNLLGLLRFITTINKSEKITKSKINFGDFGNITVSDTPNPSEMASVIRMQQKTNWNNKISLVQDEAFFDWRFRNVRKKYIFYYYKVDDIISAYVVLNLSKNNRRGYITDFAAQDISVLDKILDFIVESRHFDILSIYTYSLNDSLLQKFKRFKFKKNSITRKLEKKKNGEIPLFIRPVKRNFSEDDFSINNLDVRRIDSWSIKEIFSDGV